MTLAVPVRRSRTNVWLFVAFAVAAVLISLHFVGYDGADDRSYALGADAWLTHFPAVGTNHWATRHTVVLPVAVSLALFGHSVLALALPSLFFFFGFLAVNYFFARRVLGEHAAAIIVLLLATTPDFVVQATYINNDIVEAFFASLAFWLFVTAESRTTLFLAGLAAGLSFLTRETSAVLLLFFVVCAAFDRRRARRNYLFVALGFAAPIVAEMTYFGVMTGDMLYRYRLDAGHDSVSRFSEFQHMAKTGAALDRQGNLSVSVWADPLLMLFASQKFAALFWFAVPAAIWAWRAKTLPLRDRDALRHAARLALIWIGFISLAFPILYLVPRYYTVPAWASVVLVAYAFLHFSRTRYRGWAFAALLLLLAGNAASLYLENTDPRFAEMSLLRWLDAHPSARVTVDPDMARRSDLLLRYRGEKHRVRAGQPLPGTLYVYSPRNLWLCRSTGGCKGAYEPQRNWHEVGAVTGKPRAIGNLLRDAGVAHAVPRQIMDKIERPAPGIVIYRVR
jgi:4-amino-4-deoxy-L-arabinose transferase-like glycosyltransferase